MLLPISEAPIVPNLIKIVIEQPEPEIEEKQITWKDNPQGCNDDTHWIASEAPFYCIPKIVAETTAITINTPRTGSVYVTGNLYAPGNCTFFAKSMRPDLPNNLGNADTWTVRARNQGFATGATPRVGAIGQKGMHVVYVTGVNSDGTFNLSEWNYRSLYTQTNRTVSSAGWSFIY